MKLEEGKRYDFLVQKTLSLGDNDFFLLRGPDQQKYLLPVKYYRTYNIKIDNIISCRVDKINCRGEVFLEPDNPFYKEGKEYEFEVSGRDIRLNEAGELIPVLLAKDRSGNEVVVPMSMTGSYDPLKTKKVSLTIKRINKGRILFTDSVDSKKDGTWGEDEIIEFHIYDRMMGVDGREYFLVSDPGNSHHLLPVEHYSYYGLEKGKTFRGKYISYHEHGKYRVEPLNPYYEPGKEYELEIIAVSDRPDGPGKLLIMGDRYGLEHEVYAQGSFLPGTRIKLRVEKIRKGWPLFIPV